MKTPPHLETWRVKKQGRPMKERFDIFQVFASFSLLSGVIGQFIGNEMGARVGFGIGFTLALLTVLTLVSLEHRPRRSYLFLRESQPVFRLARRDTRWYYAENYCWDGEWSSGFDRPDSYPWSIAEARKAFPRDEIREVFEEAKIEPLGLELALSALEDSFTRRGRMKNPD